MANDLEKVNEKVRADRMMNYFLSWQKDHPEQFMWRGGYTLNGHSVEIYEQPDLFAMAGSDSIANKADIHNAFISVLGISVQEYREILENYVWEEHKERNTFFFRMMFGCFTETEMPRIQAMVHGCIDRGEWQGLRALSIHERWGALLFIVTLASFQTDAMASAFSWLTEAEANKIREMFGKRLKRKFGRVSNTDGFALMFGSRYSPPIAVYTDKNGIKRIGTANAINAEYQDTDAYMSNIGKLGIDQLADAPRDNIVTQQRIIGGKIENIQCFEFSDFDKRVLAYCNGKMGETLTQEYRDHDIRIDIAEFATHYGFSTGSSSIKKLRHDIAVSLARMQAMRVVYTLYYPKKTKFKRKPKKVVYGSTEVGIMQLLTKVSKKSDDSGLWTRIDKEIAECMRHTVPFIESQSHYTGEYTFSICSVLRMQYFSKFPNQIYIKTLAEHLGMPEDRIHPRRFFDTIMRSLEELRVAGMLIYDIREKDPSRKMRGKLFTMHRTKDLTEYKPKQLKNLVLEFTFIVADIRDELQMLPPDIIDGIPNAITTEEIQK